MSERKKIGFLNFGHWSSAPGSRTPDPGATLTQTIEMAVAAEEAGMDGAWVRSHHFQHMISSPFPLLAAMGAVTRTIALGTGVIDLRYENPLYMAEEAATTDLISGGRLQLGISRGSPEAARDGQHQFGYEVEDGQSWSDLAQERGRRFRQAISGGMIAEADPNSGWAPPGQDMLPIQPQSRGLVNRIWWGSGTIASGVRAARQGYNLLSSTLLLQDDGRPFHVQQADQIAQYRAAYAESGHTTGGMTAVTRSVFPIVSAEDDRYFGGRKEARDSFGHLEGGRARSGPTYSGTPDEVADLLRGDEAVQAADWVLLANPNQLGVEYNTHLFAQWAGLARVLGWQ
ncbi:LLM class flavin-dependent oxidoreductase [Micrococcus sp. TA1]|uniref:LLM class flavin-dependent oxidoreductase n=1 Tax=Micrococcus sp. TA1 TaxID=681627 RepID=UPI00161754A4|nr:LLM class flavin-dependent oxidoreductase [Micrococcus sp. TA1]MBB5748172.1 alkanesulfonate monooxygenase SsuD/methylene tetrahydromethanopterin reductase-like flavin-dependent oxidoreductase (luciferase family) [Micrococcus sp. TA1]